MDRDKPTVWAIQLGAGLPFFWRAMPADNACAGADVVVTALTRSVSAALPPLALPLGELAKIFDFCLRGPAQSA